MEMTESACLIYFASLSHVQWNIPHICFSESIAYETRKTNKTKKALKKQKMALIKNYLSNRGTKANKSLTNSPVFVIIVYHKRRHL